MTDTTIPPPELVRQWLKEKYDPTARHIATND